MAVRRDAAAAKIKATPKYGTPRVTWSDCAIHPVRSAGGNRVKTIPSPSTKRAIAARRRAELRRDVWDDGSDIPEWFSRNSPLSRQCGRPAGVYGGVATVSGSCRVIVGPVSSSADGFFSRVGFMTDTHIKELRTSRGWTQERLATESGVTVRTVQRLEAGNDASLETLSLVASALQVSVRDLFGDVEDGVFKQAVDDLDNQVGVQLEQRRTFTRGLGSLYYGVGTLLSIGVVAAIAVDFLPNIGILIIPAYWVGGWLISAFEYDTVLAAWLDTKYPLTRGRAEHSQT
jgi:transcriptional regulator with XRE-family HTH domain